jgi:hypothetical protein
MTPTKVPLWLRFVLLVGVAILAAGASLFVYRYLYLSGNTERGGGLD